MNRFLAFILLIAIAGNGYLAWYLNKQISPNPTEIDADMAAVRAQLAALSNDRSSPPSANAAISILTDTEAMLQQKRSALLRFVDLKYVVAGQEQAPAPSTASDDIDKDIGQHEEQLRITHEEAAKYSGGLLLALLELRAAIEEETLAALQQTKLKRKYGLALPAGVALPSTAGDADALAAIEQAIRSKSEEIAKGEVEAARYSGGLVLAMIESRVAADKMTLAMLDQRKLALKHNIRLPTLEPSTGGASPPPKPPGKIVTDKDALQ